jgi:hypothetical protein
LFPTDDELRRLAESHFEIVDFHVVEPARSAAVERDASRDEVRFQSMTLRKPNR